MVQKSPLAIGLFDLVVCGVLADPEHLVVIFPLALLQLKLCRLQQVLVIFRDKMKIKLCSLFFF